MRIKEGNLAMKALRSGMERMQAEAFQNPGFSPITITSDNATGHALPRTLGEGTIFEEANRYSTLFQGLAVWVSIKL